VLALATFAVAPSWAQDYPSKTVTIVVPLAAGTGIDTIARLYGEKVAASLGRPVIIENKPGGGMILAVQAVIGAPADGHTLLVATPGPLSINQTLYKQLPYDPEKDLLPISHYLTAPFILVVNPSLPVKSVSEFLEYASKRQAPLSYSSPAGGGVAHYAVELMRQRFGLQLNHVPYRNSPQSIQDIAAGHIDFAFAEAGLRGGSYRTASCARLPSRRGSACLRSPTSRHSRKPRALPISKSWRGISWSPAPARRGRSSSG
jgi:tripartite-type tricarboxylate transporter receptor subunit TctC